MRNGLFIAEKKETQEQPYKVDSFTAACSEDEIIPDKTEECVVSFQFSTWHLVGIQKRYLCAYVSKEYSFHQFLQ